MSPTNPRRRQRQQRRFAPGITGYTGGVPDTLEALEVVLAQTREQGCTCDPDLELEGTLEPGVAARVIVRHDDDCPLVNPPAA